MAREMPASLARWAMVVAGSVSEAGGETHLINIVPIADYGPATMPAPVIESVGILADDHCGTGPNPRADDFEGVLVRVDYGRVPADGRVVRSCLGWLRIGRNRDVDGRVCLVRARVARSASGHERAET